MPNTVPVPRYRTYLPYVIAVPVQEEPPRGLLSPQGADLGRDSEPDGGGLPAYCRPHALHQHDLVLAPPDLCLHYHALQDPRAQRFCRYRTVPTYLTQLFLPTEMINTIFVLIYGTYYRRRVQEAA